MRLHVVLTHSQAVQRAGHDHAANDEVTKIVPTPAFIPQGDEVTKIVPTPAFIPLSEVTK